MKRLRQRISNIIDKRNKRKSGVAPRSVVHKKRGMPLISSNNWFIFYNLQFVPFFSAKMIVLNSYSSFALKYTVNLT